jgi:hypothetical protein
MPADVYLTVLPDGQAVKCGFTGPWGMPARA